MTCRILTRHVAPAAALVAALLAAAASAEPGDKPAPGELRPEQLERFRKLSPAARLLLVQKYREEVTWLKVARGDAMSTIVERGHLHAEGTAIYCRVRAGPKGSYPPTIRWLIDDGSTVEKGERLIELDDAPIQEKLKAQQLVVARAQAAVAEAAEHLRYARRANEFDGKPADARAANHLRLLRKGNEMEVKLAAANLRAKNAALEVAKERLRELAEDINQCFMTAPQDGLVEYHVPERGNAAQCIVAQGEPVREGQLLLRVYDPKRLTVKMRIDIALIERVRVGQPATIKVDAFPSRALTGKVIEADTVADQTSVLSAGDEKAAFRVRLSLTGELPVLKHGMTAEVRIATGKRHNVVRVPVQAVLHAGNGRFCYVKTAKGVEERRVVTGLANDLFVEIREGLQEGERLLCDLPGLLGIAPFERKGGK